MKNILLLLPYSRNCYNRSSKRIKCLNLSHQYKFTEAESLLVMSLHFSLQNQENIPVLCFFFCNKPSRTHQ